MFVYFLLISQTCSPICTGTEYCQADLCSASAPNFCREGLSAPCYYADENGVWQNDLPSYPVCTCSGTEQVCASALIDTLQDIETISFGPCECLPDRNENGYVDQSDVASLDPSDVFDCPFGEYPTDTGGDCSYQCVCDNVTTAKICQSGGLVPNDCDNDGCFDGCTEEGEWYICSSVSCPWGEVVVPSQDPGGGAPGVGCADLCDVVTPPPPSCQ